MISERLTDAEIDAAPRLASSSVKHEAIVAAQQQPRRPQTNADAGRLAKIGQREVANGRKDVADIDEKHSIESSNERHPQLIVEYQNGVAPGRNVVRANRADRILFEAAQRRAAAGVETLARRHVAAQAVRETDARARGENQSRPQDFIGKRFLLRST
jgi:hypothetical protein